MSTLTIAELLSELKAQRAEAQRGLNRSLESLGREFCRPNGPDWVSSAAETEWRVQRAQIQLLDRIILRLERCQ